MKKMNVAFIGKSGLVGSGIHSNMVKNGVSVKSFGRSLHNDVHLDLTDLEYFDSQLFEGCDTLVFAAGVTDEELAEDLSKKFNISSLSYSKATFFTDHLLNLAEMAGIYRFVYISTAHVYGPLQGFITEQNPVNPTSFYGLAHFVTEQIFKNYFYKDPSKRQLIIVRPCSVYGLPLDFRTFKRWKLVPFYLPRMAVETGASELLPGSDRVYRNFVSSQGIGSFVQSVLEREPGGLRIINPIGGENLSIYDFAQRVAQSYSKVFNKECPLFMPDKGSGIIQTPVLNYSTISGSYVQDEPLDTYLETFFREYRDS